MAVPLGEAHHHQSGFLTLYDDALMAGLRLPLHPHARDGLIHLGIAPGQLAPNGWRFLVGAIHLWPQMFRYELTHQEFLFTYMAFALFGEMGFFSLSARPGRKIIEKIPNSNKGWKTRFFLASK